MAGDDGCLNKCFRCLANIPAPTLLSWVLLVVSVCACAASLMVAAERTRMLLEDDDLAQGSGGSTHTMHFMFQKELLVGFTFSEIVCLSVLFGMLFLGTLFLIVAILSSGKTSAHVFDTSGKNICARALNVIAIVLMALLDIAWIACCTILTVPLVFLIIVHILYSRDDKCINLKNFALASEDRIYCDGNFTTFHTKAWEALICYIVSYIGAILVAFSMTLFAAFAGANYAYLKESKPTENAVRL